MDDNKNDDLTKLIPEMNEFAGNVRMASRQDNILVNAQRAAAIQAKRQADAQKKMADSIYNTINGLVTFSKGLQSSGSGGDFGTINRTIDVTVKAVGSLANMLPVVGEAAKVLADGAGEVAKFMVGQFAKAYGTFERLSDTGVVTTFEDLRQSAASTGLNFDDTAKIFTKYSQAMANFGGAAVLGRKRVDMIMAESKEVSRTYQRIGMSSEEFAESQVQYITQLQRSGNIQGKTDKEIREGSIRYIEMIDTLSKMTGVSRKELKNQIDERQRNARYMAGIATLSEKQQEEINSVISQFAVADPELGEGIQDLIAADGRVMTDKAKAAYLALQRGGMDVTGEIGKLRKDGGNAAVFMDQASKAAGKAADELTSLTKIVGAETLSTRPYVGLRNLELKKDFKNLEIQKQTNEARKKLLQQTDGKDVDLANTRRSLYSSGQMIEQLAVNGGLVTSAMSTMAKGMDSVTSTIYASIGKDLPPYLKLRKEENDSIKKTQKLQSSRTEIQNNLIKLKEKMLKIEGDPNSARNKGLKRKYEQAAKNMESEIQLLDAQIKEQEWETQEIKERRVVAEGTTGGGSPTSGSGSRPSPPSGGGSTGGTPAAPQQSGSSGSSTSTPTPGTGSEGGSGSGGPGIGARPSEQREVDERRARGIGVIRDLIASVESVGGSYNSLFGGSTSVPLTSMTIAQVLKHQSDMLKRGMKSTAAGRYQFMSYTLPEYAKKAGFDFNTTLFNEATQDRLADILIREKGYDRYKNGQITDRQFLTNLSMAWAGLPNPSMGGKSSYDRDGLNRSHIAVEKALKTIGQARTGGIFSGPSTGYLAMLHGNEAVIPTNDGMSKQQFQQNAGDSSDEDMTKIFEMMTKKINTMISLVNDGVGIQKKAKIANVTMA